MVAEVNLTVSFSGGKDSTAMLLMMLEKNEPIHSIVFCDTGWEFPQMLDHIDKVEKYIGRKITRIKPNHSFEHWMYHREVIARDTGNVRFVGKGWPWNGLRWCTGKKVEALRKYLTPYKPYIQCVGIVSDEKARAETNTKTKKLRYRDTRFPLIEWGITSSDSLDICYQYGFRFNGLYEKFDRVSCWCCPLQSLKELRILYHQFPLLWETLKDMDKRSRNTFKTKDSVHDLEKRFECEDRQSCLELALPRGFT